MKGNFNSIINGDLPVLVDFYADWCGPCKTQAPILKDLASVINGKARIIKINVDKNEGLANRYQVRSIPTLMFFRNGEIVWKKAGVSTKDELLDVISRFD